MTTAFNYNSPSQQMVAFSSHPNPNGPAQPKIVILSKAKDLPQPKTQHHKKNIKNK